MNLKRHSTQKTYTIRTIDNDTVLYEGSFHSFKDCLEHAVKDRVVLARADLRHHNLCDANLDDAIMPDAHFMNSNLSGANISEAYLKGANFTGTALYNTCLIESNLTACNFTDASFGATDVFDAIISHSQFSSLSCFSLDFPRVKTMTGCIFINPDGRICRMSNPPIVIRGMGRDPIILMDHQVKSGHNIIDHKRLKPLAQKLANRELRKRLIS